MMSSETTHCVKGRACICYRRIATRKMTIFPDNRHQSDVAKRYSLD